MRKIALMMCVALIALIGAACSSDPTPTPVPAKAPAAPAAPKAAPTATPLPAPTTLKLLSAFNPATVITAKAIMDVYPAAIKEATKGTVIVEYGGGPETVPPFVQLDPVRKGLFDIGINHPGYHSAVFVYGGGLEIANGTYAEREKCGLNQAIRDQYKNNAGVHWEGVFIGIGNALAVSKPVTTLEDLKGLTVRVYPGSTGPFMKALGLNPAPMRIGEVYAALDRGVVEGAVAGGSHAVNINLGLHEKAKYLIRPDFGEGAASLIFNGDKWNGLTKWQQDQITGVMADSSYKVRKIVSDDNRAKIAKATKEDGAKVVNLSEADTQTWLDTWFKSTANASVLSGPDFGTAGKIIELANCVNNL